MIFLLQRRLAEWRGKVSWRRPAIQHVQGLTVSPSARAAGPSQLGQRSRLPGQCQVTIPYTQVAFYSFNGIGLLHRNKIS